MAEPLSPAAQEIRELASDLYDEPLALAAAALQVAADQVVPMETRVRKRMRSGGIGSTTPTEWMQDQRLHTRRHILAIAAELEGSDGR